LSVQIFWLGRSAGRLGPAASAQYLVDAASSFPQVFAPGGRSVVERESLGQYSIW
jgi:hypothetical protein